MPRTTTMTVRLPEEVASRLEALAKSTDRTKAYHASRAIEAYIALQEWQVQAIEEGVAAADAAGAVFLEHDEVEARLTARAVPESRAPRPTR